MDENKQQNVSTPTSTVPEKSPQASTSPRWLNKRLVLIVLPLAIVLLLALTYIQKQNNTYTTEPPAVVETPLFLSLTSPTEDAVVDNNKVKVMGTTLPNTPIVFYTEEDQNSLESDAYGNFEGEIRLVEGINTLTIEAYGENGEEKIIVMDIIYNGQP